jgi:hypothetical protein
VATQRKSPSQVIPNPLEKFGMVFVILSRAASALHLPLKRAMFPDLTERVRPFYAGSDRPA